MTDFNNLRPGDVVDIVIKGARISDKHVLDKRLWFVLSDGSYQYLPMSAEGISVDRAAAALVPAPADTEPVREDQVVPARNLPMLLAEYAPNLPYLALADLARGLLQAGYQIVKAGESE